MTDFFKELNIIDILGIGVPGCLLVLLLVGDQTAALLWADQFQGNVLAFAALLLVAGSLAGMLIQELGDLIEKGLWLIPWLDPKFHAANTVNTHDLDMNDIENHVYENPTENRLLFPKIVQKLTVCNLLQGLSVAAALLVFAGIIQIPYSLCLAAKITNSSVWFSRTAYWGLLPMLLCVFGVFMLCTALPEKGSAKWNDIKNIRNANPYIQTRLVGHGNTSKRTLFDGWRFVMRNLILVFSIANMISLCQPLDLYQQLGANLIPADGDMTQNLSLITLISSCAVCLMLVRYYHYAYLRYKYSLENFMRLDDESAETAGADAEAAMKVAEKAAREAEDAAKVAVDAANKADAKKAAIAKENAEKAYNIAKIACDNAYAAAKKAENMARASSENLTAKGANQ
jgi:hypothetical protein